MTESVWVAEKTEDGKYVWHYCRHCGIAMNAADKHHAECPLFNVAAGQVDGANAIKAQVEAQTGQ